MPFVDGFYTLSVSLADVERGRYEKFRTRAVKHPHESAQYLAARMLAFVHCHHAGVQFSEGLFEPKDPTIWRHDVVGNIVLWAQVGVPEKKKLQHELRSRPEARHIVYCYQEGEVEQLCHTCLRGMRSDQITGLECYEISAEFPEAAACLLQLRSNWEVTMVEDMLYLVIDGAELQTSIVQVDVPKRFQQAIGNGLEQGRT